MQAHMNFSQFNMLNRKLMMVQAEQNNLQATNMLLMNIQFNYLLENEEAEMGVSKSSEDIGKWNVSSFNLLFFQMPRKMMGKYLS